MMRVTAGAATTSAGAAIAATSFAIINAKEILDAHRHQDVERAAIGAVAHDRRRSRIGHRKARALALDLLGNIEQIARVEADLQRLRVVAHFDFLGRGAVLGAGRRKGEIAALDRELTARLFSVEIVETRSTASANSL